MISGNWLMEPVGWVSEAIPIAYRCKTSMGFAPLNPSYRPRRVRPSSPHSSRPTLLPTTSNYGDGVDCTPEVRHDSYSDSGGVTVRYRALFCANAVSNSRGDWREAFTGSVTNPDGRLEAEADFTSPRMIGQATKRRRT